MALKAGSTDQKQCNSKMLSLPANEDSAADVVDSIEVLYTTSLGVIVLPSWRRSSWVRGRVLLAWTSPFQCRKRQCLAT